MLIAFHKPYGVISQFTPEGKCTGTLADFHFPPKVYPIGRLDMDSEGLLLLSDEPSLNMQLLHPKNAHSRLYWAQVEGVPSEESLEKLRTGLSISTGKTLPCQAFVVNPQPDYPPRNPPIRVRKTIPDTWIGLILTEGKNRQVRRMTAAVGHPTLRLVRMAIGQFSLKNLAPREWKTLSAEERQAVFEHSF